MRRITNDMQVAHFVTKVDHTSMAHRGGNYRKISSLLNLAFSTGVYRIRGLRFIESGLRLAFWHLGKAVANHQFLFLVRSQIAKKMFLADINYVLWNVANWSPTEYGETESIASFQSAIRHRSCH